MSGEQKKQTDNFSHIAENTEYTAACPYCKQWLWKIEPNSRFFGTGSLKKAGLYLASDGDTIRFDRDTPHPAPLTAYTEYDAKLHKGECPHCGEGYWFITSSYPEVPVSNLTPSSIASFICDESYIDILEHVDGALLGNQMIVPGWVVLRQYARWQNHSTRLDVHMVGPFPGGESLVGEFGVTSCGYGETDDHNIWAKAAELVRKITPAAVDLLRNNPSKS